MYTDIILKEIKVYKDKYHKNPTIYVGLVSEQTYYDYILASSYAYRIEGNNTLKVGDTRKFMDCNVIIGDFEFGYYLE